MHGGVTASQDGIEEGEGDDAWNVGLMNAYGRQNVPWVRPGHLGLYTCMYVPGYQLNGLCLCLSPDWTL